MDWHLIAILYLSGSLLLGEGLILHGKRSGQGTKVKEYLILITLWPFLIVLLVLVKLAKGR